MQQRNLNFSRKEGVESLQELNFHQRAKIIKQIAVLLDKNKDTLQVILPTGATLNDSYLDIDGGIGTLVLAQKSEKKWTKIILILMVELKYCLEMELF